MCTHTHAQSSLFSPICVGHSPSHIVPHSTCNGQGWAGAQWSRMKPRSPAAMGTITATLPGSMLAGNWSLKEELRIEPKDS